MSLLSPHASWRNRLPFKYTTNPRLLNPAPVTRRLLSVPKRRHVSLLKRVTFRVQCKCRSISPVTFKLWSEMTESEWRIGTLVSSVNPVLLRWCKMLYVAWLSTTKDWFFCHHQVHDLVLLGHFWGGQDSKVLRSCQSCYRCQRVFFSTFCFAQLIVCCREYICGGNG